MKRRAITVDMLKKMEACGSQVRRFQRKFGKSVFVTEKRCVDNAQNFDFDWAGRHLLSPKAKAQFQAARRRADTKFNKATNAAWKAYINLPYNHPEYEATYKKYLKVSDKSDAQYNVDLAKAFAKAYVEDKDPHAWLREYEYRRTNPYSFW